MSVVRVVVDPSTVVVDEVDDLNRLAVLSHIDIEQSIARLVDAGLAAPSAGEQMDGPNVVWLDAAALRDRARRAPGTRAASWDNQWDGMIAFADQHGWMREGTHVRAHVDDDR
ncbi:MAG: hypothetical protein ACK5KK_07205 [Microbacterium sp.]